MRVTLQNGDVWRADQLQINFLVIKYTDETNEMLHSLFSNG